jgi:hypothetical protein
MKGLGLDCTAADVNVVLRMRIVIRAAEAANSATFTSQPSCKTRATWRHKGSRVAVMKQHSIKSADESCSHKYGDTTLLISTRILLQYCQAVNGGACLYSYICTCFSCGRECDRRSHEEPCDRHSCLEIGLKSKQWEHCKQCERHTRAHREHERNSSC